MTPTPPRTKGAKPGAARRLETFTALREETSGISRRLVEMAAKEDPALREKIDEQFASVQERLAALEEEQLFSGEL